MMVEIRRNMQKLHEKQQVREINEKSEKEKQETARILKEEMIRHELEVKARMQQLIQNRQLNNITAEEWREIHRFFGISIQGGLGFGTELVNEGVNAVSDVGSNFLDNVDYLLFKGFSSIKSVCWSILMSGMYIAVPALLFVVFRTGCISAFFSRKRRSIENYTEQREIITRRQESNNTELVPYYSSTSLTVAPSSLYSELVDLFGEEATNELQRAMLNLGNTNRGGKRYYRKVTNRKTRKHKKRKTKKLKYRKKRQTKHKRIHLTKRR